MSTDTDLVPALEVVAALTADGGPRAEVAAWSASGVHNRRLAVPGRNLYCHWVDEPTYQRLRDHRDYTHGS